LLRNSIAGSPQEKDVTRVVSTVLLALLVFATG
jgi:hypothetical protein